MAHAKTERRKVAGSWALLSLVFVVGAQCAENEVSGPVKFSDAVWQVPKTYPAPGFDAAGVKALFYDGLPWKGKPTRVFAWYGAPQVEVGKKVPAMVLVHGGGGTAFAEWVQLWVKRGYAVIAMDTCGCTAGGQHDKRPHHDNGGPPGWGGFDQTVWPLEDQWSYHAVADVILAHSLIRSFPEVDAERVGITGISWGGYLTCITAGVDKRFKFAVPVYGCGYLGENSTWAGAIKGMGPKGAAWLRCWDPSVYLKQAAIPMLWVDGTNDFAYPMDSLQKSYRTPASPHTLCVKIRMPHGHGGPGENPPEILAFADSFLKEGKPLARVTGQGAKDGQAWAEFKSDVPITKAELCFTKGKGAWPDRKWESAAATLDVTTGRASAPLPDGVSVYYLNLTDQRGMVVSSEHGCVP